VWLDEHASTRLLVSFDEDSVRWAEGTARLVKKPAPDHGTLLCPVCNEPMRTAHVAEAAADGVEVDACERHGTWFDKSELAIVARAIHSDRPPPPTQRDDV
jgi:hypothetical protein